MFRTYRLASPTEQRHIEIVVIPAPPAPCHPQYEQVHFSPRYMIGGPAHGVYRSEPDAVTLARQVQAGDRPLSDLADWLDSHRIGHAGESGLIDLLRCPLV